jgi:predicted DNA-binding transcriptional regulator YafY
MCVPGRFAMAKEQLVRQWEIVTLLNGSRRGLRSSELAAELDCSRATIDRALEALRAAGVPLEKDCVTGETRHRLSMKPLPPLSPTSLQLSALRLAVAALSNLDGTKVVAEIRALLRWSTGALLTSAADAIPSQLSDGSTSPRTRSSPRFHKPNL